ncbi:MAG: carbohydrate kinase family protein [Ilumatobacter sp.]|uniref:carbohydrate kinase family protein n=1 Tax=Ilumatobacter sp. TaxID=1967498 RepID=UPI0026159FF0|nr:carbohydrate kinase family protein [Ilumatobacter sp.]MDJ0771469.1 carbohydrate kinase family protein [Ilumatobacter sp.]
MLVTLGDLVEDVVVRLDGPVRLASDTAARISRRRGGSAANVAEIAARSGARARFVGQVGDDVVGRVLVGELASHGVDTAAVRFDGSTGTIVVLVDAAGERSMLTDRRACVQLDRPDPAWIAGADVLHVPMYSLVRGPLAVTAQTMIAWAHEREVAVSLDVSSVALIDEIGVPGARSLIAGLRPDVVFANADEAAALELHADTELTDVGMAVVKRGADPATVRAAGAEPIDVAAVDLGGVGDTTGAGDAFAAGFLTAAGWRADPAGACRAGHRAAAALLRRRATRPIDEG